jgi:hypothetical protein
MQKRLTIVCFQLRHVSKLNPRVLWFLMEQ